MFTKILVKALLVKVAVTFAVGAAFPTKAFPAQIKKISAVQKEKSEIKKAIEQEANASRSQVFKDTRVTVSKRGMTFSRR